MVSQRIDSNSITVILSVRDSAKQHVTGLADKGRKPWFKIIKELNPNKTCKELVIGEVSETKEGKSSNPVHFAVVRDYSGSMEGYIDQMQAASQHFINKMSAKGHKFTRVNFDDRVEQIPPAEPSSYPPASALDNFKLFGKGTALFSGIRRGIETLSKVDGPKILVVFSDGEENSSGVSIKTVFDDAGGHSNIYAIGFGLAQYTPLVELSKETRGRYYPVENINDLVNVFDSIGNNFEHYYTLKLTCKENPLNFPFKVTTEANDTILVNKPEVKISNASEISFFTFLFEYNSTKLIPRQKGKIEEMASAIGTYLIVNENQSIVITGHASPEGDSLHNLKLSKARADYIHTEFVKFITKKYRKT